MQEETKVLGENLRLGLGCSSPLSRNEIWSKADKHNYICHICAKRILDLNLN